MYVPVSELDQHWPRVKQGLERICEKFSPAWMPEHVYRALAQKEAFLSILPGCFMVWSVQPGDDLRGLMFIWALEGEGLEEHRESTRAAIMKIAMECKVRAVRMIGRKGWMKDPFWTLAGYVYEHEVRG